MPSVVPTTKGATGAGAESIKSSGFAQVQNNYKQSTTTGSLLTGAMYGDPIVAVGHGPPAARTT
jgi:hypothetical protein